MGTKCLNRPIDVEVVRVNYRRNNNGMIRKLTALCTALAVLVVGFGAWAVIGQVRVSKLNARIAALEASGANSGSSDYTVPIAEADYDADVIAAEFDGGVVTVGEAMAEYQMLVSYYEMLNIESDNYEEEAKLTVLSGLVESKLLALKAEEYGLTEMTDAERADIEAQATADYEENLRYYMEFRAEDGKSEEDVRAETAAYLAESGYTLESVIDEAIQNAWQQRLYEYVTANLSVDDDQLRAFYEEQLSNAELTYTADFGEYEMDVEAGRAIVWNPEGVRRVQSILIPFDTDQSIEYLTASAGIENGDASQGAKLEELYASLEPTAQQVIDRLNAGESFEALMAEYGSYGPEEGSCVSEQSVLYGDAFRDAALALNNIGDISDSVRTEGGLCILRYASDVTPGAVPYEQVAAALQSGYEEELKLSRYNATVVQWIADANVRYYTDRF